MKGFSTMFTLPPVKHQQEPHKLLQALVCVPRCSLTCVDEVPSDKGPQTSLPLDSLCSHFWELL